jgi:hypothetical protein
MKAPSERHILYAVCGLLITLLIWFVRSKEYIVVDNSELIEQLVDRSQKHFERALHVESEIKLYEIEQYEIETLFTDSLVSVSDSRARKDSIVSAFKLRHSMYN